MNDKDIVQQFHDHLERFIKSEKCHGENGLRERCDFIPREAVRLFSWSRNKITAAIRSRSETAIPDTTQIRENFVVVFSILVSLPTPKPQYIGSFMQHNITDDKLPLQHPIGLPSDASDEHVVAESNVFQQFMEHQWKFCPLILKRQHMEHLHCQRVLPIARGEVLDTKRSVTLQKVKVHRECRPAYERNTGDFARNQNPYQKIIQNEGWLPSTVVLKEFLPGSSGPEAFEREVAFYSQLEVDVNPYIVNYYGSFIQNNRRVIVIEYGSGGDLGKFVEMHSPIGNDVDRRSFWTSLLGLLKGLEGITSLQPRSDYGELPLWELRGSHQDIRPQNILVFREKSCVGNRYQNISFKFVDFGASDVRATRYRGLDQGGEHQGGNGMYSEWTLSAACFGFGLKAETETHSGSPEATLGLPNRSPSMEQKSDIWSLGAVMSETLVWSIRGYEGIQRYQTQRQEAIEVSELKGGFHYGAFHDGSVRLSKVDEFHESVVREGNDSITKLISSMILDYMLQADYNRRWDAGRLHDHITHRLPDDDLHRMPENGNSSPRHDESGRSIQQTDPWSNARASYGRHFDHSREPSRPGDLMAALRSAEQGPYSNLQSSQARDPYRSNNLPAAPQGDNAITVNTLYEFIDAKDKSMLNGKGRDTYGKVVKEYPEIEESLKIVRGGPVGRDQVFVIDNSESMEKHRKALAKTVRVLAYLLKKRVDPNQMELSYTSAGKTQLQEFSKSRDLENSIRRARFEKTCHMGESLSQIFLNSGRLETDKVKKPLSIYVLTNGEWQNDRDETNLSGVDDFIKQVIEKVQHRGYRWVGFQFIRFFGSEDQGMNQAGKRRLKALDDDLPGMLQTKGIQQLQSDIVDTRDFEGDVRKMIQGIITQAGDDS